MDNTPCGCSLNCFEVVDESQRKRLFEGFWKAGDLMSRMPTFVGVSRWFKLQSGIQRVELSIDVLTREFTT